MYPAADGYRPIATQTSFFVASSYAVRTRISELVRKNYLQFSSAPTTSSGRQRYIYRFLSLHETFI
jgi:hypothetical protein